MKIIWAIEAIPDDMKLFERGASLVKKLARLFNAEVQPVHILSADLVAAETVEPPNIGQYIDAAEHALETLLKPLQIPGLSTTKVITSSPADSALIPTLIQFVKDQKGDLIVAQTHGREGLSRLFLGSFVESLVLKSPVPVFTVSPHMKTPRVLKRVLFPTDFSDESKQVFETFLSQCKGKDISLVLFHQLNQPLETLVQGGVELLGGMWTPVYPYIQTKKEDFDRVCEEWCALAETYKVKATTQIRYRSGQISQSIVSAAKKHRCDIIALASQSGGVTAALIGSVAREVIRHSPFPVWVVHFNKSQTQPKQANGRKAVATKDSTTAPPS